MKQNIERKTKKDFEKKHSSFEIKSINNLGKFSGYASIFNVKDSYNDIILPYAFKKTLLDKNYKKDIKMLWQHKQEEPIGYFEVVREDSLGLYVEGQIMLDLKQGLEAYNLIKSGAVNGLSIGYMVKDCEYENSSNIRKIKEVDLFEISVVTFPANEYSNITYCKNNNLEKLFLKKLDYLSGILLKS